MRVAVRVVQSARAMTCLDRFSIQVCGGPAAGRSFTLPLGTWMVGRSPNAAVSLDDPDLASYHASIALRSDGIEARPAMGDVRVVSRDRTSVCCVVAGTTLCIGPVVRAGDSAGAITPATIQIVQPPNWRLLLLGVTGGLLVAAMADQPVIGLFGATVLVVAGVTWTVTPSCRGRSRSDDRTG